MYSLHDSEAVIFRYFQQIIKDNKQAGKQLQTLIVTCRKFLKDTMYANLGLWSKIPLPSWDYILLGGSLFIVK